MTFLIPPHCCVCMASSSFPRTDEGRLPPRLLHRGCEASGRGLMCDPICCWAGPWPSPSHIFQNAMALLHFPNLLNFPAGPLNSHLSQLTPHILGCHHPLRWAPSPPVEWNWSLGGCRRHPLCLAVVGAVVCCYTVVTSHGADAKAAVVWVWFSSSCL